MKKRGFTLAEVLITLTIIGVVAALTTPMIAKTSMNAKVGAALAKFVNTFEAGMETMMNEESQMKIDEVISTMGLLQKYVLMTPSKSAYSFSDAAGKETYKIIQEGENASSASADDVAQCATDAYYNDHKDACNKLSASGASKPSTADIQNYVLKNGLTTTVAYEFKDGNFMVVVPIDKVEVNSEPYRGIIAEVFVDIDGNKSSNKAGRDVFAFLLDASGTLIPANSRLASNIGAIGKHYIKGTKAEDGTVQIIDCEQKDNLDKNFACTGKIADNGWSSKGVL